MARAVVPRLSAQEAWLLTARSEAQHGEANRAPLLEEDEEAEEHENKASGVGAAEGVEEEVEMAMAPT